MRVGDRIIEKQHDADPRIVTTVVEGQYVMVRGVLTGRQTRISWRNLNRYRVVKGNRDGQSNTEASPHA